MKYVNNYAIGDYVELRSVDWYERNRNIAGDVIFHDDPDGDPKTYILYASEAYRWCGCIVKIDTFINKHYIIVTDQDTGEHGSISYLMFERILPKFDSPVAKFYKGEFVVPKSDSWFRRNQIDGQVPLGHIYYTEEHARFNVTQCKIVKAYPELDLYKVQCQCSDRLITSDVWWSADMFSTYERNGEWYNINSRRKYKTGELSVPKFNKGRKVRIREGLIVGNTYGGITYTEDKFNSGIVPGKVSIIEGYYNESGYLLRCNGCFISPEMLEAV